MEWNERILPLLSSCLGKPPFCNLSTMIQCWPAGQHNPMMYPTGEKMLFFSTNYTPREHYTLIQIKLKIGIEDGSQIQIEMG